MKIGIYGGTFDPPHKGHLYLAYEAKKQLNLDELWMVVSGNPPHKDDNAVSSRIMRYEMCEIAVKDLEGIYLKDFEMNRSSNCYTYEMLEWLTAKYPDNEYYFLMGEDSLDLFENWRKPEIIASCASLIVAVREDDKKGIESIEATVTKVENQFNTKVYLLKTNNVPISSSNIRNSVKHNEAIEELVTPGVEAYIRNHRLYEKKHEYDTTELIDKMKKTLKEQRFKHSVGVMNTAVSLAMRYQYPYEKAAVCGILHDCAKKYDNEKLMELAKKYKLPVSEAEKKSPHLLHSKVGAYFAKHKYKINDSDIIHAIETHTTGEPDMSLLGKIIFVADYIEPMRDKAVRLDEIRQIAFVDLDFAVLLILEDTIAYLNTLGNPMDEKTVETYEYYKNKCDSFK